MLVTVGSSEVLDVCKWGDLMLVVAETSPADASALAASAQYARLRFELVLSTATADEQTPGDIRGTFSRQKLKHVGSVGAAVQAAPLSKSKRVGAHVARLRMAYPEFPK